MYRSYINSIIFFFFYKSLMENLRQTLHELITCGINLTTSTQTPAVKLAPLQTLQLSTATPFTALHDLYKHSQGPRDTSKAFKGWLVRASPGSQSASVASTVIAECTASKSPIFHPYRTLCLSRHLYRSKILVKQRLSYSEPRYWQHKLKGY